jgi:hypothetical protein
LNAEKPGGLILKAKATDFPQGLIRSHSEAPGHILGKARRNSQKCGEYQISHDSSYGECFRLAAKNNKNFQNNMTVPL